MSFWTLISDVVCEPDWAHKGTCSSESVLLDIHGMVLREGNPQKRKPSPCKHICFTSCLHILALHLFTDSPLHLALCHFDCLSADIISPLLLFSETFLWLTNYRRCWRLLPANPPVNLHCFACLFADSGFVLLLFHEAAFWQSIKASTDTKFVKSWSGFQRDIHAIPFFLFQTPKGASVCDTFMLSGNKLDRHS